MTDAGHSLPGPTPLAPSLRKACQVLLAAGALVFAIGLYIGFVRHGNSALVFSLLGVTTLVFALVMAVLVKPGAFAFISASPEPLAQAAAAPHAEPKSTPQPEPKAEPPDEPKAEPPAEPKAGPAADAPAKTDLAILMNTTLGDILLAALRSDPEGAGRIVARAITQAESPVPAGGAHTGQAPAPS